MVLTKMYRTPYSGRLPVRIKSRMPRATSVIACEHAAVIEAPNAQVLSKLLYPSRSSNAPGFSVDNAPCKRDIPSPTFSPPLP